MDTSITKVIDNAIIGFRLEEPGNGGRSRWPEATGSVASVPLAYSLAA
jgi:hypothetical protein